MAITLDEMKNYLRVDYPEDDALIESLISSAGQLCMDVARAKDKGEFMEKPVSKIAVMYAVAYLYEHREEANHNNMNLTLRALLFSSHEGGF